jgi:hypothetical protein
LFTSFFLNSGEKIITIHPNKNQLSSFDINIEESGIISSNFSDENSQVNIKSQKSNSNLKDILYSTNRKKFKNSSQTITQTYNTTVNSSSIIKQMDCKVILFSTNKF